MNVLRAIALLLFLATTLATGFIMAVATGGIGAMLFLAASPLCLAFLVRLSRRPPFFWQ